MSKRAIAIGLMLGLGICAITYFNDWVVKQTQLIGNELPIGVFGPLVLLLLAVNPMLRLFGRGRPLRASELGVITVMALAVCGWPGSGLFRTFTTSVAMPTHLVRNKNAWQSTGVMSYVPGVSAEIAPGQVLDWPKLIRLLDAAVAAPADTLGGRIAAGLPPSALQRLMTGEADSAGASEVHRLVLDGLNGVIAPQHLTAPPPVSLWKQLDAKALPPAARSAADHYDELHSEMQSLIKQRDALDPDHTDPTTIASLNRSITYLRRQADLASQRANRAVLVQFADGAIAPSTPGDGLLLANGDTDPFVFDTLVRGWDGSKPLEPWQLPWRAWWPTLRLWGGLALLVGGISLCLVLVVHPQWSQRELLSYPIVRFVDELTVPGPYGWLPLIARNRLFWIGLSVVMFIHTVNGLHAWFPHAVPEIPLGFNFWGLREIFPNAARVDGAYGVFGPRLYPSVVAFAFFLSSEISLSLGLATIMWLFFGAILIGSGVPLTNSGQAVTIGAMLRAGAYLGSAMMILYVGRRYYLQLLGSMAGKRRNAETPGYAVWAGRIGVFCTVAAVLLLQFYAHLDWRIGILLMLLLIVMLLVMTRINVETGAFFVQAAWMPTAVLSGLLGMQGLGPQGFIVVTMVSIIMIVDPRELVTPFLANGLKMAEQVGDVKPARSYRLIGGMMVAGFFVALVATLYFQYNHGMSVADSWGRNTVPQMPFNLASHGLSVLSGQGKLADAVQVHGWGHFTHAVAQPTTIWLAVGFGLVLLCAVSRLRLSWWPLHPVIFLVWGNFAIATTGMSFLLGWAIKAAVMKFMGARGYRKILPLMIGVIAGEVVAGLGWAVIGWIYYLATNTTPASYSILPN